MSNNPHRTHKRQKSSVLNPGYYFTPETKLEIQQQQPQQQESQQQQQQQQQQHSQTHNIYDNDNYMNYNFPPTSNRPRASTTTGTTSTTHPGSELSHESHSVHTSPLKRTASSELDQPIPAMAPSSPLVSSAPYYYQQPSQQQNLSYHDHHHQQQQQQSTPQGQQLSQQTQLNLQSGVPPPLYGTSSSIPPGSTMQPSTSFAFHTSHSTYNPSFDSSNLYNLAFRLPEYPTTSSSSLLSTTGGKQFQQSSALLPSGTLPPSILGTSSSLHVSALRQHQKNNLSISSHLTLFSLSGNNSSQLQSQGSSFQQSGTGVDDTKRSSKESTTIFNDLLFHLTSVDGSNINTFLLSILRKINSPFTLDDFYNLLYNDRQRTLLDNSNYQNRIDKTIVSPSDTDMTVSIINQLLNFFKTPSMLVDYFPNMEDKDNKLANINYHELLRTFLAIKILHDILIQLPISEDDDPQNYTIPRLSIYKTYYIICQKLIASYPSASNTRNEQQKLILGQSKLGKLIKLVYPNLLIKRLGSRGESKYNYLGVMWNANIVQEEIKQLCDEHELNDLNEIFNSDNNNPFASIAPSGSATTGSTPRRGLSHKRTSSKQKIKTEPVAGNPFLQPLQTSHHHHHSHHHHQEEQSQEESLLQQMGEHITAPRLSFLKANSKYPTDVNLSVLDDDNWFVRLSYECYARQPALNRDLIQQIFLKNEFLLNNSSLLRNLMDSIIKPLVMQETYSNVDLVLYLAILLEILPYLLLVKSSTNINLLKNLRLNLLHLINNFNNELKKLDSPKFPIERSTIFLVLVKKLINLNDLLITFIKLINLDNCKTTMSSDIENFLKINSQTVKLDDDDNSFFFNLNTTSMGEVNFNFKNEILSNDLIYTLIGYNFDPTTNSELKSSISMNFINEEINVIDEFFKNDLLNFLSTDFHAGLDDDNGEEDDDEEAGPGSTHPMGATGSQGSLSPEPVSTGNPSVPPTRNTSISEVNAENKRGNEAVLTPKETAKLNSLISLIDKRLLSSQFKSKYPILMYNNCISYILNDILKHIFLKQQQQQLQSSSSQLHDTQPLTQQDTAQGIGSSSSNANNTNSSFGNWWVFNSFIQEYMSLIGELVGLHDNLV